MTDVPTAVVLEDDDSTTPRRAIFPRRAWFPAGVAISIIVGSVIVRLLTDPHAQDLSNRLMAPTWAGGSGGWMGTDQLGRSVAARISAGVVTSATVAVGATLVGLAVGAILGMIAGYMGGRVDHVLGLACDVQLSFPALLVAMVFVKAVGHGVIPLILILGLTSWMLYFRMARSSTLGLVRVGFIEGARSVGLRDTSIMARHIFPNILQTLITVGTLEGASHMLGEVALSFLGFGIQPPQISLGLVLADGRSYIATQWWITTFAGVAISGLVLSLNMVGRALQPRGRPNQKDY